MSITNAERAQKLLAVVDVVTQASKKLIAEWESEDSHIDKASATHDNWIGTKLPSHEIYYATRTILAACGTFGELVGDPQNRLLEVACEYFEARSLHIAAEHRIADILAQADPAKGVHIDDLGKQIGIMPMKLARILRTLCSAHIFKEVQPDRYANNAVSAALVNNEPLRAYVVHLSYDIYTASDKLPKYLIDPVKGQSTDVSVTAFQEAMGTTKARWEWLEEPVKQADGTLGRRLELDTFGLAMLGGGRVFGTPLYHDFPWESLGSGLVVDVGGGVGGMSMDLSKRYPKLNFVVQDRAPVIEQAKGVWQREHPAAVGKRVTLMPHDFFKENPIKAADVYLVRYILHDRSDDYCVDILKNMAVSMGLSSRILVADQVMNTTLGCPELESAPKPLLANYGTFTRFAHCRDVDMMTIINGLERTPDMFRDLAKRAGLEMSKIWECRGIVSFVEMRLPEATA